MESEDTNLLVVALDCNLVQGVHRQVTEQSIFSLQLSWWGWQALGCFHKNLCLVRCEHEKPHHVQEDVARAE